MQATRASIGLFVQLSVMNRRGCFNAKISLELGHREIK